MTDQQPSAPARAKSGRFTRGVEHVNEPHTDNFVVVGNHLAQHPELSLMAIGLAVHIQSLPAGASVGIKVLAGKFPEGEIRIAAALRELEEHGYLARPKERLHSGRYVTRTLSYNKPRSAVLQAAAEPESEPEPHVSPPPKPSAAAANLLAELRTYDSRLLLTERDVQRLTPAADAWLERGVPASAVLRTLASDLPTVPIKHPAALLAHRLKELLPPALPAPEPLPAPAGRPDPWQDCDGDCGRVFRAPEPGRCRDCRPASAAA
ncbi:helix-turn-helix domain-containing protein [Streptomyces sp. NBC_00663]|uniref:helix-turn-helix domain-containing protein n=1 Tax=Streptomyces sp. NBC_00663 TaxID=2975801 RepID=UPI002E3471F9|nr:helix-turn-helix domain-containing protein [Streptomyces sp. NBC_00663]